MKPDFARRRSAPVPSRSDRERGETPPVHAEQVSAGGVVTRRNGLCVEVCLIAKHEGRVWALPKGRRDEGESAEQTAVREVLEETGHEARVVAPLGTIGYEFHWKDNNTHYHKTVTYFLMELTVENARPRDSEADAVEWVAAAAARDRVTHENERQILEQALSRLFPGGKLDE